MGEGKQLYNHRGRDIYPIESILENLSSAKGFKSVTNEFGHTLRELMALLRDERDLAQQNLTSIQKCHLLS